MITAMATSGLFLHLPMSDPNELSTSLTGGRTANSAAFIDRETTTRSRTEPVNASGKPGRNLTASGNSSAGAMTMRGTLPAR
jgi:hypothetical protein